MGKILRALGHNLIFHGRHLIEGAQIALNQDIRPLVKRHQIPLFGFMGRTRSLTPLEMGRGLMKEIPYSNYKSFPRHIMSGV